ncbi:hypothetical protein [Chamaesiphon sp. OTE_75_metabat_556]|uniref:DUF7674 family protein n=1 Tax=Chamaesiphon sp. OTE_75_metabat_556 TaxID=2964692 RepID=UPI00286BC80C|nr:hypothetical protein [Chamaesiphon sp. OTE_75_metabat_556]
MEYSQIDRTNCMEIILSEFPAFEAQWVVHLDSWPPIGHRPIALDIAEFAEFAIETIVSGVDAQIDRLAAITEVILLEGDSIVEYTFRRMFLEHIAHRATKGGFSIDLFTTKLRPLGLYHWQSLDRHLTIDPSGIVRDESATADWGN